MIIILMVVLWVMMIGVIIMIEVQVRAWKGGKGERICGEEAYTSGDQ